MSHPTVRLTIRHTGRVIREDGVFMEGKLIHGGYAAESERIDRCAYQQDFDRIADNLLLTYIFYVGRNSYVLYGKEVENNEVMKTVKALAPLKGSFGEEYVMKDGAYRKVVASIKKAVRNGDFSPNLSMATIEFIPTQYINPILSAEEMDEFLNSPISEADLGKLKLDPQVITDQEFIELAPTLAKKEFAEEPELVKDDEEPNAKLPEPELPSMAKRVEVPMDDVTQVSSLDSVCGFKKAELASGIMDYVPDAFDNVHLIVAKVGYATKFPVRLRKLASINNFAGKKRFLTKAGEDAVAHPVISVYVTTNDGKFGLQLYAWLEDFNASLATGDLAGIIKEIMDDVNGGKKRLLINTRYNYGLENYGDTLVKARVPDLNYVTISNTIAPAKVAISKILESGMNGDELAEALKPFVDTQSVLLHLQQSGG